MSFVRQNGYVKHVQGCGKVMALRWVRGTFLYSISLYWLRLYPYLLSTFMKPYVVV